MTPYIESQYAKGQNLDFQAQHAEQVAFAPGRGVDELHPEKHTGP